MGSASRRSRSGGSRVVGEALSRDVAERLEGFVRGAIERGGALAVSGRVAEVLRFRSRCGCTKSTNCRS